MARVRNNALRIRELLADTENAVAAIERQLLHQHRLCYSDLAILRRLSKKGARPVNTLAPRIGLTSGSMTTAVQRLRRRGFVDTRRDSKDKRVVWVEITSEGESISAALDEKRGKLYDAFSDVLTERESKLLVALLKKLRRASRSVS